MRGPPALSAPHAPAQGQAGVDQEGTDSGNSRPTGHDRHAGHRSRRQQRRQRESQGAAADIAQENPRPREIEGQEARAAPPRAPSRSQPQTPPASHGASAAATNAAWLAARPLMPSMKFQTLVSTSAATNAASASHGSPQVPATRQRKHGRGEHVHRQPQPGRQRPMVVDQADAGDQHQSRRRTPASSGALRGSRTAKRAAPPPATPSTMAMPPPRGVGDVMAAAFAGLVDQLRAARRSARASHVPTAPIAKTEPATPAIRAQTTA